METIGIGIIGCGRIADMAFEGYSRIPGARIAAVCDTDETAAIRRGKEWGAKACYTDYRRLLEDPAVDAVEILTPHTAHTAITLDAISAGKHVALQKPMTVDRPSAERLVRAAAEARTVCKVTENYVFYPPIRFAAQVIREGWIGSPSSISLKLIAGGKGGWPVPPSAWAWRVKELSEGRGMQTFDHGHHLWSTARFLLGPFEKVSAWIGTTSSVIDSPAAIMWKYRDRQAFGICEYVYAPDMEIPSPYYANDEWIQISGSAGILTVNRCTGRLLDGPAVSVFSRDSWRHYRVPSDWKLGFIGAAWNFIRAIRGEEEPLLSFPLALEILSIDLAIAESARKTRTVRLAPGGAPVSPLRSLLLDRREIGEAKAERRLLSGRGGSRSSGESAARAVSLTEELPERFDPEEGRESFLRIGLELADGSFSGGVKLMSMTVEGKSVRLERDRLPTDPSILIRTTAEVWASILSGRTRIETAYLQGKLRFTGPIDTALSLKKLFRL